jgi:F-type H+-transporting ATPase subunit epsilon
MATFHLDLVSPEKLLFAGDVGQVDLPGSEGDLGVLAGHAPLVTALRPGIIVIYREGGDLRVVVNGGFAEVGPSGLTVLADMAVPAQEFDLAVLAGEIKDTEEDFADAADAWKRDKLANRLDQLKALQAALSHSGQGGIRQDH